ncbi:hypothetical protein ACFL6U_05060 [Planctomycetota bacterium]
MAIKQVFFILLFVVGSLTAEAAKANTVSTYYPINIPSLRFAVQDIEKAMMQRGDTIKKYPLAKMKNPQEQLRIAQGLLEDEVLMKTLNVAGGNAPSLLNPEGYSMQLTEQGGKTTVWAIGADETGAMYAGLALAEKISFDGLDRIQEEVCQPHISKRGLKINIPLDARTPAYADCGDAAQQNMLVMWDIDFWKQHLDRMARYRYNTITFWNAHPFPAMVKVPEYPDVAIDDVMIADIDWREWIPRSPHRIIDQEIYDHLRTIKKMTVDEKIAFWQEVKQYAHDRGIEIHMITWNIFVWGADVCNYGISDKIDNEITIDYLRKSVCALFETYPLLAGIGVTAGENMKKTKPDDKEQWLWKTYGLGVMDAKKKFPDRKICFIHRYW